MPKCVPSSFLLCMAALTCCRVADAQPELLVPPEDAPQYRLSNLRVEDGHFGKAVMVFDYERTREGKGSIQLAGSSSDGPLTITFSPNVNRPSGEVRLERMGASRGGSYDYEFYFVQPAYWAGKSYGQCLVSNSVRIGNPGRGRSPRSWNGEERVAYEKNKLASTPPESPPPGYELLDQDSALVPGMPVKAGRYGDWVDAEILSEAPGNKVSVRYDGHESATTIDRDGWLAADPDVLSKSRRAPESFKPSMRVLPGGSFPLPRDAVAIDPDLALPKGAPLLLSRGSRWEKVFVLEDMGAKVRVRYAENSFKFDYTHSRNDLAIRKETLTLLEQGNADERYAENLVDEEVYNEDEIVLEGSDEGFGKRGGESYHIFDKSYPVEARVPRGAQVVPEDIELAEGTPVGFCWARKWQAATVVGDRGRKLLIVKDGSVAHFAYRVDRDQIIIQDETLRRLRRAGGAKAADLSKTLRTWTDASGQHKVEARFVLRTEDKVTLRTDAGREIVLPIAKLSDEDQQLLEGVKPAAPVENPFE